MVMILLIVHISLSIFYQLLYLSLTYKKYLVFYYIFYFIFLGFEGPKMPFGPGGP